MIKKILIAIIIASSLLSCQNTNKNSNNSVSTDLVNNPITADEELNVSELPILEFKQDFFDFGLILEGEVVVHKYEFTNTGKTPLIISNVSTTCGCTVPTYSKAPVAPGESGYIEVSFDSHNRSGIQNKTVSVLANTQPNVTEITFVAEVESNN